MTDSGQRLWAYDDCQGHQLPDGRVLVRNPRSGRHALLTADVYGALQLCREFRTLEDHARQITSTAPGLRGQEAAVIGVLESVRKDGLLIAADIYATLLQPSATPRAFTDRPVAAIITWERPEALERCLGSLHDHCDLSAVERLLVIDDSRSAEARQQNRAATEAFAAAAAAPVAYLGDEEQRAFMQALIHQAPALEAQIRVLVDRQRWEQHWTSGLARTVALLCSVGRRLLVLDDDVICRAYEAPQRDQGVSFAFTNREAEFYADATEWAPFAADGGPDPLARHARILGLGISDALAGIGAAALDGSSFAGAELGFMERLRADSAVLVTECGSYGDPGTARMEWLTGLGAASRRRLLASEESVRRALTLRRCWNGRSRPTFTPRSNISQLTGLDNRRLLPPYIPIMRGEDRLFGDMVRFLHPGAVALDQPWGVPHLPVPEREWSDADRALDIHEPFPSFSLSLSEDDWPPCNATEPLERMATLGRVYEELAKLDHEALVARWTGHRLAAKVSLYGHLQIVRAETAEAPPAWTEWLDQAIGRLDRSLTDNPVAPKVRGYPGGLEDERLTAWWRDFWREFGLALRAWPQIRAAARRVMERNGAPGS